MIGGLSNNAAWGGVIGGLSSNAACGGVIGGLSSNAAWGGVIGGLSNDAKATLDTAQAATKAARLNFMLIAPNMNC